jgi:hypothetical protein
MANFAEHFFYRYMHHLGIRHIVACICAKPRNSAFLPLAHAGHASSYRQTPA